MVKQKIDWSKILIRSSALGCLYTEPKLKVDKDKGLLSVTAKKLLLKTYIMERWGRTKDITTAAMSKGLLAEESGLTILSRVDKQMYVKNKEQKSNKYICGHADIVHKDIIIDTKLSWDAETFLPKLLETLDPMYEYQLQAYMWLWDKPRAKVSYCLVNTPDSIIQNEKRKLLYSMDVVTDEDAEYKLAAAEMERNMIFDDIPIEERVFSIYVDRNEEIINSIPEKVEKARAFLQEFENLHLKRKLETA